MRDLIELDSAYSTTRRVRKVPREIVEAELKAIKNPEDQFKTILFLPRGEGSKGEGGLRTRGCFKKSSEEKPLITLITVVFNGEKNLEETILSVINQTYDNVEYILIDGGSADATLDIVRKYENVIDYWVSGRDSGVYDAINKGISLALGKFVGLTHVGSELTTNAVEKVVRIGTVDSQSAIIAGSAILEFQAPSRILFRSEIKPLSSKNTQILHETLYIPLDFYKMYGFYDITFKISADFSWVSNALRKGAKVVFTDAVLIAYKVPWGISGDSRNFVTKIHDHYRVMRRDVGIFFAIYRFLCRILGFYRSKLFRFRLVFPFGK